MTHHQPQVRRSYTTWPDATEISYEWMINYNERRPHDALGGLPPVVYREKITAENSTSGLSHWAPSVNVV